MSQEVEVKKQMAGQTVMSFSKPTPMWATWIFRIVFLLTTAATIYIASTHRIKDNIKVEVILIMKCVDVVVWGIGKGIGVKKDQFDTDNP